MPKVLGLHHAAISVTDMDRAVAFYGGILGFEKTRDFTSSGFGFEQATHLPGVMARVVWLEKAPNVLELFQFINPKPRRMEEFRVCDHGFTHIGFLVDDIFAMYDECVKKGVRFNTPPAGKGNKTTCYLQDPDGNIVEFMQMQEQKKG